VRFQALMAVSMKTVIFRYSYSYVCFNVYVNIYWQWTLIIVSRLIQCLCSRPVFIRYQLKYWPGYWLFWLVSFHGLIHSSFSKCTMTESLQTFMIITLVKLSVIEKCCIWHKNQSRQSWLLCGLRHRYWPLGNWECGSESSSRHRYLSFCFCIMLPCVDRGLATGWSLIQEVLTNECHWFITFRKM
jgi:hypothetical protein